MSGMVATRRKEATEGVSFLDMPDEIVVLIYSHLLVRTCVRSEGVCRRFRTLLSGIGWKGGRVFGYLYLQHVLPESKFRKLRYGELGETHLNWNTTLWRGSLTKKALNRLNNIFKRMGPYFTDIDFATSMPPVFLEPCWELVLKHCTSRLQTVKTYSDDEWFVSRLPRIGDKLPKMKYIEFQGICRENEMMQPGEVAAMCQTISEHFPQLRVFALSDIRGDIGSFVHNLPKTLHQLDIIGNLCMNERTQRFCWQDLLKVKKLYPELKKLTIIDLEDVGIHDAENVEFPFDIFDRIEALRFWNCIPRELKFGYMPALQECYLSSGATDRTIESLCDAAPNLAVLELRDLQYLSSAVLGKLSLLTRLAKLCVNHNAQFNDDILEGIARNGRLTHISMCNTSVLERGIQALLAYCEDLKYVDVSLTTAGLKAAELLGNYAVRNQKHLRVKLACSNAFMYERHGQVVCSKDDLETVLRKYPLVEIDTSTCWYACWL